MKGRTLLGKNEGEGRKIGLRRRTCLFACAVAFALTASGQNLRTQVTNFSVTNVTLKEALQQLEKQVDLGFFYESAEVAGVRGVTLHLGRTTVEAHGILHASGRKMKHHKKTVDAVAATLILEGYLTFRRTRGQA